MNSDYEGKIWTFDRRILATKEVCFSSLYAPGVR